MPVGSERHLYSVSKGSCVVAIIVMLVFGLGYRAIAQKLQQVSETPINLPVPLKELPVQIGLWHGKDMPLPESVLKTAANDDYVNRLYINNLNRQWANIYVAYSARPRTMLGHRPDVCYVGAGWVLDSTERSSFKTSEGQELPCLIHRFHRPTASRDEVVVLNFYVVNGVVSSDESLFSGVEWRTPNIKGNAARYVAQVQVSSVLENTVRAAGAEIADEILDFLPDENGLVKASAVPDWNDFIK